MNVDFKGFGENVATFAADSGLTAPGVAVKVTEDGKVAKCSANDKFCGICIAVRDGYATVQLRGYAEFKAGSKIAPGYQKLAANSSGGVAINDSAGRELLVVCSTVSMTGVLL